MWAFPVTPFGPVATFEEFMELGLTDAQILPWYKKLADFSAVSRNSYLIYMHPPGATNYPKTVVGLLNRGKELKSVNRFQWYTMTELASFAQRHLDTVWNTTESYGKVTFKASHPTDHRRGEAEQDGRESHRREQRAGLADEQQRSRPRE